MKFTETHPERGLTAKSQPGVRLCPERNEPPPQPADSHGWKSHNSPGRSGGIRLRPAENPQGVGGPRRTGWSK